MDKCCIMDDKKKHNIHFLPSTGQQEIHRNYGLWIIRGGSSFRTEVNSFNICNKRYFQFYSLSHMYAGFGRAWLEPDIEKNMIPGDCVIVTPRTLNRYGGWNDESYYEDCINFCGPVADMMMRSGVLANGVFHMGRIRRILPILEYASSPDLDSQIRANIELQKLLTDIYFESRKHSMGVNTVLDELISNIRSNPEKWWSVKEMANMCNLSVDQMRRVFLKKTGVLPKIYIDRLKLTQAADFLLHSNCGIKEVAKKFGYQDQYHFSRRFKALIGLSPLTYRKKVGSLNPLASLPEEEELPNRTPFRKEEQ